MGRGGGVRGGRSVSHLGCGSGVQALAAQVSWALSALAPAPFRRGREGRPRAHPGRHPSARRTNAQAGRYCGRGARAAALPAPPPPRPACCSILGRLSPRPPGASMRSILRFTLIRTPVTGRERGCVGRNIETNNKPPPSQSHLSCSEMNFGKRLAPNLI